MEEKEAITTLAALAQPSRLRIFRQLVAAFLAALHFFEKSCWPAGVIFQHPVFLAASRFFSSRSQRFLVEQYWGLVRKRVL